MFLSRTLFLSFSVVQTCLAAPLFGRSDATTSTYSPTSLSQDTLASQFLRPAQFSRIAYCSSAAVTSWQCGGPCSDLGYDVEVLQAGGDDGLIPKYFIAHDPSTQSIVVAHEGTDPFNLLSILNDVQVPLVGLNSSRFPNIDASVQVHDGFQKTFERTADDLLAGVQAGLASKGVNKVLVTGHSLGAAIAMMDSVLLHQELDSSVQITATVFGLPRGGNAAWADFLDATLGDTMAHMTNQNDPVPTLPPRFLDYQHSSGEVHIRAVDSNGDATDVVECPGQENENCSEGNSVFDISVLNHLGPYLENVSFGTPACPL